MRLIGALFSFKVEYAMLLIAGEELLDRYAVWIGRIGMSREGKEEGEIGMGGEG